MNTLVAGIGNIFLGDDAFGVEVIRRMPRTQLPENVKVIDFGIRGFDLAYSLMDESYDLIILVDAVTKGGTPGTLYVIEPSLEQHIDVEGPGEAMDAHGMNPMRVFNLVKKMGGRFKRILILGCEPETLGPEEGLMGLSQPVDHAVDEAVLMLGRVLVELDPGDVLIKTGTE